MRSRRSEQHPGSRGLAPKRSRPLIDGPPGGSVRRVAVRADRRMQKHGASTKCGEFSAKRWFCPPESGSHRERQPSMAGNWSPFQREFHKASRCFPGRDRDPSLNAVRHDSEPDEVVQTSSCSLVLVGTTFGHCLPGTSPDVGSSRLQTRLLRAPGFRCHEFQVIPNPQHHDRACSNR